MWDRKTIIWSIALTIVAVGQIVAAAVFYNCCDNAALTNLGWAVMAISGVLGWLPIFTFRKRGGVPKGESYMQTTQLVDTGIYAIVRHPQYLALMIMSVALVLIAPHWLVILPGVAVLLINYVSAVEEEQNCIEQFGDTYRDYMTQVPRFNAVLGLVRWLRRRAQ